jgi:hypothetical protein
MTNSYPKPLDASHDLLITLNQKIEQLLIATNELLELAVENTQKLNPQKSRRAPGIGRPRLIPEDWKDKLFQGLKNIHAGSAFNLPDLLKCVPELRACGSLQEFNRKAMKYLVGIGVEVWAKPADGSYLKGPGAMRWLNEAEVSQWLTWRKRSIPYRDALKFRHHFTAKDFITASADDDLI